MAGGCRTHNASSFIGQSQDLYIDHWYTISISNTGSAPNLELSFDPAGQTLRVSWRSKLVTLHLKVPIPWNFLRGAYSFGHADFTLQFGQRSVGLIMAKNPESNTLSPLGGIGTCNHPITRSTPWSTPPMVVSDNNHGSERVHRRSLEAPMEAPKEPVWPP